MQASFSDSTHAIMGVVHENHLLLEWSAGIATAAFIAAVIGGWVGRALIVIVTAAGFMLAFPAAAQRAIHFTSNRDGTVDGTDKIAMSVGIVGVLALALSFRKVPDWLRTAAGFIAPAVIVSATIWVHRDGWTLSAERWTEIWQWGGGSGLVGGLLCLSTESIAGRTKGVAPVLVSGLFAAGVAGLLANTGQLMMATLAAIPAVAVLGSFLGGLFGKRPLFDRGPVLIWIVTLASLLGYGTYDSDQKVPLWIAVVTAAPLLAWVGQVRPVSNWKPVRREFVRGVFVAIPIFTILTIASIKSKHDAAPPPTATKDNPGGWDE